MSKSPRREVLEPISVAVKHGAVDYIDAKRTRKQKY